MERNSNRLPHTVQPSAASAATDDVSTGRILAGTGLALASMILIPALAQNFGLGSSLTSALRVALMKASNKV